MEGDIADLPSIMKLAKTYGARVMVDDAHAIGVLGGGRGTGRTLRSGSQVDLIMGTYSKSLAPSEGLLQVQEK